MSQIYKKWLTIRIWNDEDCARRSVGFPVSGTLIYLPKFTVYLHLFRQI